jgi:hypothetical protein
MTQIGRVIKAEETTAGCNPKLGFLDRLKACAEQADLDKDQARKQRESCAAFVGAFILLLPCAPGRRSADLRHFPRQMAGRF